MSGSSARLRLQRKTNHVNGSQPEFAKTLIRTVLIKLLRFQRDRADLEKRIGARVQVLAKKIERDIESIWRQMAQIQAFNRSGVRAESDCPGYVSVIRSAYPARPIYFPFHLIPAAPDERVLDELISLGERLALNRVGDHETSMCLSGSVLVLKDVTRVGDIDFCEYIPAVVPPDAVAEAFRDQVEGADPRHCTVAIRTRTPGQGADELNYVRVRADQQFSEKQLEVLSKLIRSTRNFKTTHLVALDFSGVMEATNWAIVFQTPLEGDPISGLSFAHQEAALGTFARRPLHTAEALGAYLNFLRAEMEKHARSNPVKALKRAIAWLRLFGHDDLRLELLQLAESFRALKDAALLSKIKLLKQYRSLKDLRPEINGLVDQLEQEIQQHEITGYAAVAYGLSRGSAVSEVELLLEERIAAFGQSLVGAGLSGSGKPSLLDRIVSLAE